jgi:hypothetical protein
MPMEKVRKFLLPPKTPPEVGVEVSEVVDGVCAKLARGSTVNK